MPGKTRFVQIYREDPIWETYDHWWEVPARMRDALFVKTYEFPTDEDGYVTNWHEQHLPAILDAHPGCIYVFTPLFV